MHPLIVIPARIGSTRIPGKPLSEIDGEPLVQLVVRNVLSFDLGADIVVATDDSRVEQAAGEAGTRVILTSRDHRSGTERVSEVAQRPEYSDLDLFLNVQCDQPCLPREAVVGALAQVESGFPIGTAAAPLQRHQESNRSRVKVAVDSRGQARSFSRAMPSKHEWEDLLGVFLHLGVYAYTREALLGWTALPPTAAEFDEGLEQLRPFLNGTPIGVALMHEAVEPGIDTLEDLAFKRQSSALTRKDA